MINHGGSGSVTGALAHGVPMVVLPMGADQPLNAARCEQLGVGIVLDAVVTTSDAVAEAVTAALDDPAYRVAAERIRDEIAGLPGPEAAIPLLARLHHRREDDR
jgi:UDP:flavonoid glycosyltransferase YjiC (YdhE family)